MFDVGDRDLPVLTSGNCVIRKAEWLNGFRTHVFLRFYVSFQNPKNMTFYFFGVVAHVFSNTDLYGRWCRTIQESRAVAEKPRDAVVKFDTCRNLQRHRVVLPAIALHLVSLLQQEIYYLCHLTYINVTAYYRPVEYRRYMFDLLTLRAHKQS